MFVKDEGLRTYKVRWDTLKGGIGGRLTQVDARTDMEAMMKAQQKLGPNAIIVEVIRNG